MNKNIIQKEKEFDEVLLNLETAKMNPSPYKELGQYDIIGDGYFKGRKWVITFSGMCPCAYVERKKDDNFSNFNYLPKGGLTYEDEYFNDSLCNKLNMRAWGWDYCHEDDWHPFNTKGKVWTTKEILEDIFKFIINIQVVEETKEVANNNIK